MNSPRGCTPTAGVLLIDVSGCVDPMGALSGRAAAGRVPVVPRGAAVRLYIGAASIVGSDAGQLVAALRPAGSVEIVGTDPAGVAALVRMVRAATARGGDGAP